MFELLETFETGDSHILRAEMLRVMPPSAEVQGHSPEQRVTVGGKRHVKIAHDLPIGNYAVRLVFHDGRDRRIFTWTYLMELCVNGATKWDAYLEERKAKGLGRG